MTPDCPRVGKLIRGCRWEGRYDDSNQPVSAAELSAIETFKYVPIASNDLELAKIMAGRCTTYVRDVCRTCGAVRERVG